MQLVLIFFVCLWVLNGRCFRLFCVDLFGYVIYKTETMAIKWLSKIVPSSMKKKLSGIAAIVFWSLLG